ncbi:MAG: hypothetical protein P1U74_04190 [Legionellaceae bacterium]|nr:hypothetical protein [Legionellaceae bacterium]
MQKFLSAALPIAKSATRDAFIAVVSTIVVNNGLMKADELYTFVANVNLDAKNKPNDTNNDDQNISKENEAIKINRPTM